MTGHVPRDLFRPASCASRSGRFDALLAAALLLAAGSAAAAGAVEGGYEIRREGDSPYLKGVWQQAVHAQRAGCIAKGIPFRLVGDIGTAADAEIVEYHHPGLRRSSEYTRYSEPVTLSECHVELRYREITRITHFDDRTQTVFTHEVDPARGPQPWRRLTQPHLDGETIGLLRQAFSLDQLVPPRMRGTEVTMADTPGLEDDRIAGRACRWRHTRSPVESHSCVLREGIGMPIDESLSGEYGGVVDGRRIVVNRSRVVRFEGPVAIPASVFEPGDADQRDEPDDEWQEAGGDALATHFDALIEEWCAIETERRGGIACQPGGAGLSDPRVRTAIIAWCAEEATRTGVNRCEKGSHASIRR